MTEKEQEEEKEKEIDQLLEFAYDLDYEKFMEDFEIRQAFEIIKDRVTEIKKDEDWKDKIAEEWKETAQAEGTQFVKKDQDATSVYSYSKYLLIIKNFQKKPSQRGQQFQKLPSEAKLELKKINKQSKSLNGTEPR